MRAGSTFHSLPFRERGPLHAEAYSPFAALFLEKWGGSLAVHAKMAETNKCLARSNKPRTMLYEHMNGDPADKGACRGPRVSKHN